MLGTQACLFNGRRVYTCFSARRLGILVVNKLVTFTIYRARPHRNAPDYYAYLRLSYPKLLWNVLYAVNVLLS